MLTSDKVNIKITADDQTRAGFKSAERGLANLGGSISTLGAAIGGLGLGALVSQQVAVISEFERLGASLQVVTGSAENAKGAMAFLREFAKETPYQLQEVVDSFIKLKAMGLDPSEEALTSYGNTAGAMGKTLNQMIEAVADAATGEFERLKEFGIKARSEGDNVSFTFQGVTTTVKKNADEIEGYLMSLGQVQFAGGMEKQMATLGGKMSNLQDAWDGLIADFGSAGASDSFKAVIGGMIWSIEGLRTAVNDTPKYFVALFAGIEKGWEHTAFTFDLAGLVIQRNFYLMIDGMTGKMAEFVDFVADQLAELPFFGDKAEILQNMVDGLTDPVSNQIATLNERMTTLREEHRANLEIINQTAIDSFREIDAAGQSAGSQMFGGTPSDGQQDTGSGDDTGNDLESYREQLQSKLEALSESLMTERELLAADYEEKQILLDSAMQQKLLSEEEFLFMSEDLNRGYQERLTAIEIAESIKRQKQAEQERKNRIKTAQNLANAFSMISKIMSMGNEKQSRRNFEIQKAANIGQAVMNTYTGATKALASGGIWGIVQAALVIAYGMAQVSQIQSQKFDSGGGGGATSAPALPTTATPEAAQIPQLSQPDLDTVQAPSYHIEVHGNIVDHDKFARELITPLEQARLDGEEAEV